MFVFSLLVNDVHAQSGAGSSLMSIVPFIAIFVLMYFLVIRPQSKRAKEQKTMQESLTTGKFIVTTGGIIGRVVKVEEQELHLEVSKGQVIRMFKAHVAGILENQKQSLAGKEAEEVADTGAKNARRPAVSKAAAKRVAETKKKASESK